MSVSAVQPVSKLLSYRSTLLKIVFGFYVVGLATSMSFMEIGSALLFLFFLAIPEKPIDWKKLPFSKPLVTFVVIAILGILMGHSTFREKLYDLGRMRFFLLYVILYYFLSRDFRDFRWISVLRVVTFIVGLYGFVQHFVAIDLIRPEGKKVLMYALQDEKIGPLVVGTFNHHLTFSNSYLFFACLFLSLGLLNPKERKWDLGLGAFLFLLVFWTQSRVAWIAIPFCLVLLSYLHYGKKFLIASIVGVGLLLGGLFAFNPSFQERLSKTFEIADHRSYLPRFRLWQAQIEMFKEKPLFGVGWNNNERHSKSYVDRLSPTPSGNFYGHAHSMLLQILATTGAFGLLAFLWLWGEVFKSAIKLHKYSFGVPRAIAIGAFASFVGFWIQGLTQWNFGDAEVLHTVIFFWAVVASLNSATNSPHSF